MARRVTVALLALAVALVLADSAVVTLALPDILTHLRTSVTAVAWVLIAFNLVLGLAAVPAAWAFTRRRRAAAGGGANATARVLAAAGIAVFAVASAACAAAGTIEVLLVARCAQALGGALALLGCLELLVQLRGERRGVALWVAAGVAGTAVGPFAGGLLTEAFSWQAIFVVQVPFAALAVPAALAARPDGPRPPSWTPTRHRPALRANLTLALLSAALTAALFLLVLLLVEGWRRSPGVAALAVSVVPIAALAARPLARLVRSPPTAETAAGCLLTAGGLAALAVLPAADLGWTVAPQALVGLGLGFTVDRLTTQAMELRLPRAEHAGWTLAARHLGVVAGLAVLTPVFTADLRAAQEPGQQAIAALVLDAPLPPQDKVDLARTLADHLAGQSGDVPDVDPVFADAGLPEADRPAADALREALDDQITRAATRAFRDSFLVGAAMALLALVVVLAGSARRRTA